MRNKATQLASRQHRSSLARAPAVHEFFQWGATRDGTKYATFQNRRGCLGLRSLAIQLPAHCSVLVLLRTRNDTICTTGTVKLVATGRQLLVVANSLLLL